MDWKTASSYYEARLSDALNVQRHAVNLLRSCTWKNRCQNHNYVLDESSV